MRRAKNSLRSLQPFEIEESPSAQGPSQNSLKHWLHWGLSLGVLYVFNSGLAKAVAAAGISFPSPLIGEALAHDVITLDSGLAKAVAAADISSPS